MPALFAALGALVEGMRCASQWGGFRPPRCSRSPSSGSAVHGLRFSFQQARSSSNRSKLRRQRLPGPKPRGVSIQDQCNPVVLSSSAMLPTMMQLTAGLTARPLLPLATQIGSVRGQKANDSSQTTGDWQCQARDKSVTGRRRYWHRARDRDRARSENGRRIVWSKQTRFSTRAFEFAGRHNQTSNRSPL